MKKLISAIASRSEYDSRLITLYILNVTDYIFTLILLSGGLFTEANPVISPFIRTYSGFAVKILLPLMLILFLHIRFCTSTVRHPNGTKRILNVIIIFYGIVNLMHLFWLCCILFLFM